jgi:hypothetical protein
MILAQSATDSRMCVDGKPAKCPISLLSSAILSYKGMPKLLECVAQGMPADLIDLPVEIRSEVFSHCARTVLKRLRFVCAEFEMELAPRVWDVVYLDFLSADLARLARMASSLRVNVYVRKLVIFNVRQSTYSIPKSHQDLLRILLKQWFPNVISIIVRSSRPKICTWYQTQSSLSLLLYTCAREGLRSFALQVERLSWRFWGSQERRPTLVATWADLTCLQLCVEPGVSLAQQSDVAEGLREAIQSTESLRSLNISFFPGVGLDSLQELRRFMPSGAKLMKLQKLRLFRCKARIGDLCGVLSDHIETLREVELRNFHLLDGDWQQIVKSLAQDFTNCQFRLEALTSGDDWMIRTFVPFCRELRLPPPKQSCGHCHSVLANSRWYPLVESSWQDNSHF